MKKVILITGGNSGLGKATAEILSKRHDVIILGKNEVTVPKVAKKMNCYGIVCDVTDEIQVRDAIYEILKKYKKIDCLVNCAGAYIKGPIEKNYPADMKNVVLVNTLGPMFMTNAVVGQMKKQKHGRIVNVVYLNGHIAKVDRSVYAGSKWAMTGFTKCLQLELHPFNISVMGFYPGFIHTELFKHAGYKEKLDFSTAMSVAKCAKVLAYMIEIDSDLVISDLEVQSIKQS